MVITIDGPAGAGKSTVARKLAERLGFRFLDTGAMYRAVAWAGRQRGVDWDSPHELAAVAEASQIELQDDRVLLDGEDVTSEIRTSEATSLVRFAADNRRVRDRLVELQRRHASNKNIVSEGRDQGTIVFPNASCKIFLTASPEERARRRVEEIRSRGQAASLDEVLQQQNRRDAEDEQREYGRLRAAEDAIPFATDGLQLEEVVDRLEEIVRRRLKLDRSCRSGHP